MKRVRVDVLALGGTIAMTGAGPSGVSPTLTADDLLAAVPGLPESGIDVRAHQLRQLPGASLTLPDLLALHREAGSRLADGAAGVVVVQGTDTIEESGYVLDLLHTGPAPIAVTGAMRNPTQAGADGPANLLAAIRTAASPVARDLGCLVVFSDEIHAAARVCKVHTSSTAAFRSPDTGPIGAVVEGRVHLAARPAHRITVPAPTGAGPVPRIAVYPVALGDDGYLVDRIAESCDGLVVAGFGVGHVPAAMVPALGRAAARLPVVLTSRTGAGAVHGGTYGFPGSETDLLARGLINGGYLRSYQARLLLQLLLLNQAESALIRTAVMEAGGIPGM